MAGRDASSRPPDRTGVPLSEGKAGEQASPEIDQAFDRWLTQGLHVLFDPVVDEPLPEDLLGIIEADRTAAGRKG